MDSQADSMRSTGATRSTVDDSVKRYPDVDTKIRQAYWPQSLPESPPESHVKRVAYTLMGACGTLRDYCARSTSRDGPDTRPPRCLNWQNNRAANGGNDEHVPVIYPRDCKYVVVNTKK
ncbi:hypothetical protein [Paraburkholderia sp.]|uniref:hypothetical protein n=1 Tax=Paraburkholderia sp. TaxID=1926495 RepID=UPI0025ECD6F6|nr:hypothetical protein [Paraburkholderia sp.]